MEAMSNGLFIEMVWFECGCGVAYGMSKSFYESARITGRSFYCVNGCTLSYGEGEVARLRRLKEQAERLAKSARAERDAALKQAERYKCPHCPRTYATAAKLQRHERDTHQSPLRLPKDAGPDALNSKVD
jgi:hypothetical protein